MSEEPHLPAGVDAALARLQGSVDTGFAQTNGRLELMLHRADQQDQRVDRLDKRVQELEVTAASEDTMNAVAQRVRDLEGSRATSEDVKEVARRTEQAVTKEDLATRQKHILGWTTVIVTIIGILVGAGVAFLT